MEDCAFATAYVPDKKNLSKHDLTADLNIMGPVFASRGLDLPRSSQLPSPMVRVDTSGMAIDCRINNCAEYNFGNTCVVDESQMISCAPASNYHQGGMNQYYINQLSDCELERIIMWTGGIGGLILLAAFVVFVYKCMQKS